MVAYQVHPERLAIRTEQSGRAVPTPPPAPCKRRYTTPYRARDRPLTPGADQCVQQADVVVGAVVEAGGCGVVLQVGPGYRNK